MNETSQRIDDPADVARRVVAAGTALAESLQLAVATLQARPTIEGLRTFRQSIHLISNEFKPTLLGLGLFLDLVGQEVSGG